jgi:RNA polymerase sigma factor (sigma-70 family)
MKTFDMTERWSPWEEAAGAPVGPEEDAGGAMPHRWLEVIYRRYWRLVWKKLFRRDIAPESVEGMHQDVFLTLGKLTQKKGPPKCVPVMLLTIAGNVIRNYLRRRERRPTFDANVDLDDVPASRPDGEQRLRGAERERLVEAILTRLPREAAMLIRWIDLGEMTPEEVAAILRRPAKTVRTQHRRARERFDAVARRLYKEDLGGGA